MNFAGISASLSAIVKPTILRPTLRVPSIAALDLAQLKARGVSGVIIDKDNCITKPHVDQLADGLEESWNSLVSTFGPNNVLVVSNSAGVAAKDSLLLQAEAVSRSLSVPVLVHKTPKPGPKCVAAVADHFTPPANPPALGWLGRRWRRGDEGQVVWCPRAKARLGSADQVGLPTRRTQLEGAPTVLVIGDRLATDMILATRLAALRLPPTATPPPSQASADADFGPIASTSTPTPPSDPPRLNVVSILTTQLHAREGAGTTFLRSLEKLALWLITKYRPVPPSSWQDCVLSDRPTTELPVVTPDLSPDLVSPAHPRLSRLVGAVVPRLESVVALWTRPRAPREATGAELGWRTPGEEVREFWEGGEKVASRVVDQVEKRVEGLRSDPRWVEMQRQLEEARRRVAAKEVEVK